MKKEYVYVLKEEYIETNNENIRLTAENIELNLELQRKNNNWNELKEWVEKQVLMETPLYGWTFKSMLDKINELRGDNNV